MCVWRHHISRTLEFIRSLEEAENNARAVQEEHEAGIVSCRPRTTIIFDSWNNSRCSLPPAYSLLSLRLRAMSQSSLETRKSLYLWNFSQHRITLIKLVIFYWFQFPRRMKRPLTTVQNTLCDFLIHKFTFSSTVINYA